MLKRSINAKDGIKPSFMDIQLSPTRGSRLQQTMVLIWSWAAIKSAIGGEYV